MSAYAEIEVTTTAEDQLAAIQHKYDALTQERREIEAQLAAINNSRGGKWKGERTPLIAKKVKIETEMGDLRPTLRDLRIRTFSEVGKPPIDGNNAQLKAIRELLEKILERMP